MAIKVSGTTVINDSRALQNIASVDSTTAAAIGAAGVGGSEYNVAHTKTTTNRTLAGASSSWVTHLTLTFTVSTTSAILCFAPMSHGYEYYDDFLHGRFELDATTGTPEVQLFKQGNFGNYAYGAHNAVGFFANVSSGSHTVRFQLKNYGGGTSITNYHDTGGAGDNIFVLYK